MDILREDSTATRTLVALYPFWFALAPIAALFADNYHQLPVSDLFRPFVTATALVLLAYVASYVMLRNLRKSALLTLFALAAVFVYGPARTIVPSEVFRARYYFLFWLLIAAVAVISLRRTRSTMIPLTKCLHWVGVAIVVAPLVLVSWSAVGPPRASPNADVQRRPASPAIESPPKGAEQPDIYFIILDAHGREDVLQARFGMKNVALVKALRTRGFHVIDEAISNYAHTHLSLAATFNLTYLRNHLDQLGELPATKDGWWAAVDYFRSYIADSAAQRFLEMRGYRTMGNRSGYNVTRALASSEFASPFALTEFERALLEGTVLDQILARFGASPHDRSRGDIVFSLERLPEVACLDSPKFIVVHVLCPHAPFVFDDNGGSLSRHGLYDRTIWHHERRIIPGWSTWYRQAYASQVQGLSQYVEAAIDGILANSTKPPVIVVQGDHGPGLGLTEVSETSDVKERFGILSAFYLPGDAARKLYPRMSSVNTFRLLFN